ncbi:MAG: heme-binding protein [Pseudomonadota bacterium]
MPWNNVPLAKRISATLTVAGSLVAASVAGAGAIESPDYEVLLKDGPYEVRRYQPYIVAETTVSAENSRAASSKAFMTLAGYIFGANAAQDKISMTSPVTSAATPSPSQKIDMTSPVTSQGGENGNFTVQFSMPSKWTMETLPTPLNDAVQLREVEGYVAAVVGYIGERSQTERDKVANKLAEWAIDKGWRAEAGPIWAGYDGPSVASEKRRYELQLPVADRPEFGG